MALFKILKGDESNLPAVKNEGWAYFCQDSGKFFIDISASERKELFVSQSGALVDGEGNSYGVNQLAKKTEADISYVTVATLAATGWTGTAEAWKYTLSLPSLACGRTGDVPPIITWSTNQAEYSEIADATATAGSGIVFTSTADNAPSDDIEIIIIDNK